MNTHTRFTIAFIASAFLISIPCSAQPLAPFVPLNGKQIVHSITEKAYDTNWPVTHETRRIDANSDIIVSFEVRTNIAAARPSAEWITLTNIVHSVQGVFAERAALRQAMRTAGLSDTNSINRLKAANQAFSLRTVELVDQWQEALGFKDDEAGFNRILTGEFDGQTNRLQPYFNLSRWITNRLADLNQQAAALVDQNSELVTVQAFHSPVGKARTAVHVANYDSIPAGELQPIDRTGLRMTPAEQARLQMELEMCDQAAKSIREIQSSRAQIGLLASNLFAELAVRIRGLQQVLQQGPEAWKAELENSTVTNTLRTIAQDASDPNAQKAAGVLLGNLTQFQADLNVIDSAVARVQALRGNLTPTRSQSVAGSLFNQNSLIQQMKSLATTVTEIVGRVGNWPARIADIRSNLQVLGSRLTDEEKAQLLPIELQEFVNRVQTTIPATLDALGAVREFMNDKGLSEGADTLANTDVNPIWHDAFDLVPGTIELTRAGLSQGDEMLFKVSARAKEATGAPGKVLSEDTYKVQTVLMGFHREFGASVIFARGLGSGTQEREWKPNVAAHVQWLYRFRDESGWHKTWNAIEPGM